MASTAYSIVSSSEELVAALKAAKGGETILLADGDYGSQILDTQYLGTLKAYSQTVTIAAINPGKAVFDTLDIRAASNLAIDGLVAESLKIRNGSSDISVTNSDIDALFLRDITGLKVSGNDIGTGTYGVVVQSVKNAEISGNYIHESTEDLMRIIGSSSNVVVEDNLFYDTVAASGVHADLIQMYGYGGASPTGITIRGNILYDNTATGSSSAPAQSIFISDPQGEGYKDILVEQNLIWATTPNTIHIKGGEENVVIQDNSLIALKGSTSAMIRAVTGNGWTNTGVTIEGNIARGITNEGSSATVTDNYTFGTGAYYTATKDQTDIYQHPAYIGWESFLPVSGSAIDFGSAYGAQTRLQELLGGVDDHFGTTWAVFELAGESSFKSTSSWLGYNHQSSLATDEATISLSFTANALSGLRGILSKDSAGLSDGLSVFISDGTLKIRFEDDNSTDYITYGGIKTGTEYDLLITFGDGEAQAWLNGTSIGSVNTDIDWSDNEDKLVVGAFNNNSTEGSTSKVGYVLDGSVSNVQIYDRAMEFSEAYALTSTRSDYLTAANSTGDWSKIALYTGGQQVFNNTVSKAVVYEPSDELSLSEGTVVMNFNTDVVSWYHGLVARNSKGLDNGFDIYTYNSTLYIRFEDETGTQTITHSGLSRLKDYHLIVSFEDGVAQAWLDGVSIGSVETDMDWTQNDDKLIVGALNTNSTPGTTSAIATPFDGTINGFMVLNEGMTPDEVASYTGSNPYIII